MNIQFKKLKVYNFLSFGNAEIDLSTNGYTIVRGINHVVDDMASSNGSGKSSIWEAISWALTGETIRGTKNVININSEGGTYVELTFKIDNDDYVILRSKEHKEYKTNLKIYVNGEDKSGKGIRDTEKLLHEYLPDLTSSLIGSVIILGQGLPQRFSNNTPSGRKEVLEKLSKSDFMIADLKDRISEYKKTLGESLRKYEDDILKLTTEKSVLENQIKDNENKINEYSDTSELKTKLQELQCNLSELNNRYKQYEQEVEECKKSLNEHQTFLQEENTLYSQKTAKLNDTQEYQLTNALSLKIREKELELKALNSELNKLKSITDICPTCGQKLVGVEKPDTSTIEMQIDILNNEIIQIRFEKSEADNVFQGMISNLKNAHDLTVKSFSDIINDDKKELNEAELNFKSVRTKIDSCSNQINDINTKLNSAETIVKTLKGDMDNCKNKIVDNEQKLLYNYNVKTNIEDKLSVVSKMTSIITRDFRGVLLSNAVEFINNKSKEYSKDVFDTNKIEFKLDGNNISISYDGKEYENLSGGERQKVDLIVQFAIRDMLCTHLGFSSNIIVLDELFDNLDDIGCQKVLNLIATKLTDVESIFIVTHHTSISIPYDNEIIVEKGEDKISRVK